jgi:hypothetical protein
VGRGFCPTSATQGECVQLISLGGLCRFEITIHVPLSRCFLSLPMLAVWVLGPEGSLRVEPVQSVRGTLRVEPSGPGPQPGVTFFLFSLFRHKCFLHQGPQGPWVPPGPSRFCPDPLRTGKIIADMPLPWGMRDARYPRRAAHWCGTGPRGLLAGQTRSICSWYHTRPTLPTACGAYNA